MTYEAWGEPDDDRFEAAREAGWIDPIDQTRALIDVMNERDRQWNEEGFTPELDDQHDRGEMAQAAACYALHSTGRFAQARTWPWKMTWWKPITPRRDLVKSCALLLAEIERLDRAASKSADHG